MDIKVKPGKDSDPKFLLINSWTVKCKNFVLPHFYSFLKNVDINITHFLRPSLYLLSDFCKNTPVDYFINSNSMSLKSNF